MKYFLPVLFLLAVLAGGLMAPQADACDRFQAVQRFAVPQQFVAQSYAQQVIVPQQFVVQPFVQQFIAVPQAVVVQQRVIQRRQVQRIVVPRVQRIVVPRRVIIR